MRVRSRFRLVVLVATLALLVVPALPASATKAPAPGAIPTGGHKITICHATRSLTNPYVVITIDVAAWNNPDAPRHHGDHHTRTKNGVTWSDKLAVDGQCTLAPPPPCECPPPPPPPCDPKNGGVIG